MTTVYLVEALKAFPRILSQLNRSPASKTFGCFDREYWHYTTIDFPSMRKQEAVLSLAYAYMIPEKNNHYYQSPLVRSWIIASLNEWARRVPQGLDEWYPGEDSYVCNAFNLYAITQTFLVLKEQPSSSILRQIERVARRIAESRETRVQNQLSAAPIGLWNAFKLTGNAEYRMASEEKVQLLSTLQHPEGWFLEYGGADIGYLSLTIHYLSKYYDETKDEKVLVMLRKACEFIMTFLHPDGTVGGEYASRNTEYLIPSGFELLSRLIPEASTIASFVRSSLAKHSLPGPAELDDRYLLYTLSTYFEAHISSKPLHDTQPPYEKPFMKLFPSLGITIRNAKHSYIVLNERKGGAFQLVTPREHVYDTGITAVINGRTLTSGYLHSPRIARHENTITISGLLAPYHERTLTTSMMIPLRIASAFLKRAPTLRDYLKKKLRDHLITPTKTTPHEYTRMITFDDGTITIVDSIRAQALITSVSLEQKQSSVYVPSSRLFTLPQLSSSIGRTYRPNAVTFTVTRVYGKKRKVEEQSVVSKS